MLLQHSLCLVLMPMQETLMPMPHAWQPRTSSISALTPRAHLSPLPMLPTSSWSTQKLLRLKATPTTCSTSREEAGLSPLVTTAPSKSLLTVRTAALTWRTCPTIWRVTLICSRARLKQHRHIRVKPLPQRRLSSRPLSDRYWRPPGDKVSPWTACVPWTARNAPRWVVAPLPWHKSCITGNIQPSCQLWPVTVLAGAFRCPIYPLPRLTIARWLTPTTSLTPRLARFTLEPLLKNRLVKFPSWPAIADKLARLAMVIQTRQKLVLILTISVTLFISLASTLGLSSLAKIRPTTTQILAPSIPLRNGLILSVSN